MLKKMIYWIIPWAMLSVGPVASALDDGLYAVFHTSMGSLTTELYYADAPMTVANFVGLAEGTRTWMDEATGAVRMEPFYDGTIFHRVITHFMIQGGSRNQMGTDGPGYRFPDEIPNGLWHAQPGVLSMANSGLNSNGSQFFITVNETPWLDGVHTVFGQVIRGQSVVDAINGVPVGNGNRPIDDVTLDSIEIVRIGPDAEAFDGAHLLPVMGEGRVGNIFRTAGEIGLEIEPQSSHAYHLRESFDLVDWSVTNLVEYATEFPPVETVVIESALSNRAFYAITEAEYPGNDYAPANLLGKAVEFEYAAPESLAGLRIQYLIGPELGHSIRVNGDPAGGILGFIYERLLYPHEAHFMVQGVQVVRIDHRMHFSSPTNGIFSAIVYSSNRVNRAQGVFSVTE